MLPIIDGERVIGNNDYSVLASSDLEAHYEIAVLALLLEAVHDETV